MDNHPSWKQIVAYLVAAGMSATLLVLGQPPDVAAVPSFLVWFMLNRKGFA
jgi:hypothetical protein